MEVATQQQYSCRTEIDVISVDGEPMWRAIISGKEYLERSGVKFWQLVSHLTAVAATTARLEAAQD